MARDPTDDDIDHDLVEGLCEEFYSHREYGHRITLEDVSRRCQNRSERVALLTQLLPDEVSAYRQQYHRDPTCEELTQENPSLRDEIFAAYEHLDRDYRYPTHFRRYRVVRVLSTASAQSVVVKGRDDSIGRDVAIKYSRVSADRPRLRQEGHLLEGLKLEDGSSHPNVIDCLDIENGDETTALVLEYLQGTTLMRAPRPDLATAIRYTAQIADALALCHRRRVFHCDISPNNIFLSDPLRAVLIDFGLAIEQESGADARCPMPDLGGTPEFFPPERLRNEMARGDLADLYSLAAVLYWMVCGEAPPPTDGDDDTRNEHLQRVPRRLQAILKRALAPRPEDRFETAADFCDALKRLQKQSQRRIAMAVGVGSLLCGGLALYGFSGAKSPGKSDPLVDLLASPGVASELIQSTLCNALAKCNVGTLKRITRTGLSTSDVALALGSASPVGDVTIAESFFKSSCGSPEAISWFRDRLRDGLDPNLIVRHGEEENSLLHRALWMANSDAVLALLDAGATPHPYHRILGTYASGPSFLFPLARLRDFGLSLEEQRVIASRMVESGVVVAEPVAENWRERRPEPLEKIDDPDDAAIMTLRRVPERLGVSLEPTPKLYVEPRSPIVDRLESERRKLWADFLITMPKTFIQDPRNSSITAGEIRHLLAIHGDRAYFLGLCHQGSQTCYTVFETSLPGEDWTLYFRGGARFPVAGWFGDPELLPGEKTTEYAFERTWWRGVQFTYDRSTNQMKCRHSTYRVYRDASDFEKDKKE